MNLQLRTAVGLIAGLMAFSLIGCTRQPPQLNFMLGGGQLTQDAQGGVEPVIDNRGGMRVAIGLDVPVQETAGESGPRLGGRVSFSGYRQGLGARTVAGEPLLRIDEFAQLGIITPQFVASYRQVFGDVNRGAGFIEPGLGLGLALGVVSFGSDLEFGDQTIASDIDRTVSAASYSISPFLRGGYTRGQYLVGLEGGYQLTGLDFDDNLGRNAREWYVGLFFGIQLGHR